LKPVMPARAAETRRDRALRDIQGDPQSNSVGPDAETNLVKGEKARIELPASHAWMSGGGVWKPSRAAVAEAMGLSPVNRPGVPTPIGALSD
jgi:hypothetical protein